MLIPVLLADYVRRHGLDDDLMCRRDEEPSISNSDGDHAGAALADAALADAAVEAYREAVSSPQPAWQATCQAPSQPRPRPQSQPRPQIQPQPQTQPRPQPRPQPQPRLRRRRGEPMAPGPSQDRKRLDSLDSEWLPPLASARRSGRRRAARAPSAGVPARRKLRDQTLPPPAAWPGATVQVPSRGEEPTLGWYCTPQRAGSRCWDLPPHGPPGSASGIFVPACRGCGALPLMDFVGSCSGCFGGLMWPAAPPQVSPCPSPVFFGMRFGADEPTGGWPSPSTASAGDSTQDHLGSHDLGWPPSSPWPKASSPPLARWAPPWAWVPGRAEPCAGDRLRAASGHSACGRASSQQLGELEEDVDWLEAMLHGSAPTPTPSLGSLGANGGG